MSERPPDALEAEKERVREEFRRLYWHFVSGAPVGDGYDFEDENDERFTRGI